MSGRSRVPRVAVPSGCLAFAPPRHVRARLTDRVRLPIGHWLGERPRHPRPGRASTRVRLTRPADRPPGRPTRPLRQRPHPHRSRPSLVDRHRHARSTACSHSHPLTAGGSLSSTFRREGLRIQAVNVELLGELWSGRDGCAVPWCRRTRRCSRGFRRVPPPG